MALTVYLLGAVTSLVCALLLARAYRRTHARLLLWSAICFAGFFINNILLMVELRVLVDQDLSVARSLPLLAGISCLVYGLVWDSRS